MRAYSVGLEAELDLTDLEIENLRIVPICGTMKFMEVGDERYRRIIPVELRHTSGQEEFLEVRWSPKGCYYGDAENIIFSINNEFYTAVREDGSSGGRFLGSGKLLVFRKN